MPETKLKYKYLEPWQGAQQFAGTYVTPMMDRYRAYLPTLLGQIQELPSFTGGELGRLMGQRLGSILGGEEIGEIYAPLAEQYKKELEEALGGIRSRYITLGTPGSSSEALAMAEATEGALQNLGQLYAQLMLTERERQMRAMPLAMQYGLLPYQELATRIQLMGAPAQLIAPWLQIYGALQPQLLATWVTQPGFWDYLAQGMGSLAGGIGMGLGFGLMK
jgi:hypothetical protein